MFVKLLRCSDQIYFSFLFQKALKKAKVQLAEKIIAYDNGPKDVENKDEADFLNGGKGVIARKSSLKK